MRNWIILLLWETWHYYIQNIIKKNNANTSPEVWHFCRGEAAFHWPQPFEKFSGEEEGGSGTIVSFPGLTIADELAATPAAMAGLQQKAPCADIVRRPVLIAAPGTAEIQLPLPAQTP